MAAGLQCVLPLAGRALLWGSECQCNGNPDGARSTVLGTMLVRLQGCQPLLLQYSQVNTGWEDGQILKFSICPAT